LPEKAPMNRPNEMRSVFVAVDLARGPDFELGPLSVRPSLRRVIRDGREEAVQPRVMQVLVALARAKGAVVSREELVETCWDGIVVGDDSITHSIAKVRQLADCGSTQAFEVETIPRVGYRLVTAATDQPVEAHMAAVTPPQAAAPAAKADVAVAPRFGPAWRKIALPATLVAVAAVALLVGLWAAGRNRNRQPPRQTPLVAAVLPFTPLDSDRNAQAFADEISADVADTLGRTEFSVISPAQSFQFRGDAKARAARALHADILVDGNVKRSGDDGRFRAGRRRR
jgi:DNA-binding winged helix-turn-helix (wHTH) protein